MKIAIIDEPIRAWQKLKYSMGEDYRRIGTFRGIPPHMSEIKSKMERLSNDFKVLERSKTGQQEEVQGGKERKSKF